MSHRIIKFKGIESIPSKTKHTLIAGLSGQGKGMVGEWYIPKFAGKFKVFDMNSQSRGEGMFYSLNNSNSNMLKRLDMLSGNHLKSQAYPNEIIMFNGSGLNKIQKIPKNIKVCVFNEDWLDNQDLINFIALNENQKIAMEAFCEMHGNQRIPLKYVYDFFKKAYTSQTSKQYQAMKRYGITNYAVVSVLRKRALMLLRSGLFHNDPGDMNNYFDFLDIEKSLKDVNTITSFSTYLIENESLREICINMLIKKFIELLETRQVTVPILFYLREGNDFYRGDKKDQTPYRLEIQTNIDKILRKGRSMGGSEVMVVMDTQQLGDLPSEVFNNFNKHICFKLPFSDSKKLVMKADIPELYLRKLSSAKVGMFMYVASGVFQYPCLGYPTLHKKADPSFDVFNYLGSKFGFRDYKESKFIDLLLHGSESRPEFSIDKSYYNKEADITTI